MSSPFSMLIYIKESRSRCLLCLEHHFPGLHNNHIKKGLRFWPGHPGLAHMKTGSRRDLFSIYGRFTDWGLSTLYFFYYNGISVIANPTQTMCRFLLTLSLSVLVGYSVPSCSRLNKWFPFPLYLTDCLLPSIFMIVPGNLVNVFTTVITNIHKERMKLYLCRKKTIIKRNEGVKVRDRNYLLHNYHRSVYRVINSMSYNFSLTLSLFSPFL